MLRLVRGALGDLAGAIRGSVIMSLEIEDTLQAVRRGVIPLPWLIQVPPCWPPVTWPHICNLRVPFYYII